MLQNCAYVIYSIGVGTKFALGGPLSVMPSVGLLHSTHANAQQASHVGVLVLYIVLFVNVHAMYSY